MALQTKAALTALGRVSRRGAARVREDLVRVYEDARYGGGDMRTAARSVREAISDDVTARTMPLRVAMRSHPILLTPATAILGALLGVIVAPNTTPAMRSK